MKISTKGRYALRMMLDLAEHEDDGYISLKEIAERQGISKKYLEQIVPLLNKEGALKANRGYLGGYRLSKSADEYTVGDIIRFTEGSLSTIACLEHEPNLCRRQNDCSTLYIWKGLNDAIENYLDGITLRNIIDHNAEIK